mmetsp:Transcript_1013/g.1099  ORF Transcript_1013/g.1099 Transcript_1013/m.1099 type:complete len:210 (-) Transcript_1013:114-743(-)
MKERKELVRRKFILEHKQPTNERTTTTTERRMIEMNINKQIQTINTSNDHNRGRDGRRLEKDGRQNPDHDTGDGIGIITKQFSSRTTTHDFRTTAQQVQPKQKEIQKEEHNGNTNGNHAPFTGTMTTTRLEDFPPRRIFGNIVVGKELPAIAVMDGSAFVDSCRRYHHTTLNDIQEQLCNSYNLLVPLQQLSHRPHTPTSFPHRINHLH